MIWTTRAEIDEMRARGFDTRTIQEAEDRLLRTAEAAALCELVRQAFSGVRLGDGVGLIEGLALDDYAPEDVQRLAREKDEKECWDKITSEDLNAHSSSLSFFDSAGMRFHLPAFLVAELKGDYHLGLAFTLTHLSDHCRSQFVLLNQEQRDAVRKYLEFLRSDPSECFHHDDIDRALREYWSVPG